MIKLIKLITVLLMEDRVSKVTYYSFPHHYECFYAYMELMLKRTNEAFDSSTQLIRDIECEQCKQYHKTGNA